jgi:2-haloacid dehalogenase
MTGRTACRYPRDFALATLALSETGLRQRLMQLYLSLDPFPEGPPVLRRLRGAGLALAIVSNGTPGMLATAVENAGLGCAFDQVLSVEAVGVYKPHPAVYGSPPSGSALPPRRGEKARSIAVACAGAPETAMPAAVVRPAG